MTTPLPILESLRIKSPCELDWDTFTGDERVRHCESCRKNVVNLSAMTQTEAAQTLLDPHVQCVRILRDADDGSMIFAAATEDEFVDAPQSLRRRSLLRWACTVVLVAIGLRSESAAEASPAPRVKIDRKKLEQDAEIVELLKRKPQFPVRRPMILMGKL